MNSGGTFLTVAGTYSGYCQNCQEPRVVARIAVSGWPYNGAMCSQCLIQLADEVERRPQPCSSNGAGKENGSSANGFASASVLAVAARGGNGHGH